MAGGVTQRLLGPGADFRGDWRHPGVEGDQDARPLPQGLHHPAAFARQLILVVADLHQGSGVLLAALQRVGTVVVEHVLAKLLVHPRDVVGRLDLVGTGGDMVVDLAA